jgi:hypothetical protein
MPECIHLAQNLPIRDGGYDEYLLQKQIYDNPTCLGLGELEAIGKERLQSSGGRLDVLLKDPVDDTMYEVEVMLGETDETHIIRTIEYWDKAPAFCRLGGRAYQSALLQCDPSAQPLDPDHCDSGIAITD